MKNSIPNLLFIRYVEYGVFSLVLLKALFDFQLEVNICPIRSHVLYFFCQRTRNNILRIYKREVAYRLVKNEI